MRIIATLFVSLMLLVSATAARPDTASGDSTMMNKFRAVRTPPAVTTANERNKIELGKALFFDPILSRSSSHSCASCHDPALSWGDGQRRAIGDNNNPMKLRAPTLIDIY